MASPNVTAKKTLKNNKQEVSDLLHWASGVTIQENHAKHDLRRTPAAPSSSLEVF
jgi:hypothetical protein